MAPRLARPFAAWVSLSLLLLALTCSAADRGPRFSFQVPGPQAVARCLEERELGSGALRDQDWSEAAEHFKRAVEAFPGSHADWHDLGRAQAQLGEAEAAIRSLGKAGDLGAITLAEASTDPVLEPLRDSPEFDNWLRSLPARRERRVTRYEASELARSREELDGLSASAETRLANSGTLLGRVMSQDGAESIARWKAASLHAWAEQAVGAEARADLRWEALRCLLHESMRPLTMTLAPDVIALASTPGIAESAHWLDATHALAEARWTETVVDSPGGAARPEANAQYRADLLALAAAAEDQPALERVLRRLVRETIDDLPLASRLYRRLLKVAADPEAARRRAQLEAPAVVLAIKGLPALSAVTTDGRNISNETLNGRVTLLHFWATWCPPCKPGLPKLRSVHQEFGGRGLDVIGVASESGDTADPAVFADWCRTHEVTWPQVLDTGPDDESLSTTLGFSRIPHLILIDGHGRIAAAARSADRLIPALEALLPAEPAPSPVADNTRAVEPASGH